MTVLVNNDMKPFNFKYGRKQETDDEKEENVILIIESEDEVLVSFQQEMEASEMEEPTLSPARLQLDCSKNVDEEAVEQWINEDSTLERCEVLSDDDIVSRVTCGSEETKEFRIMS
ncbi:hypothetical protein AVEN_187525-1 [Araneus ventricosus]|uniref:Uncharacterized protein n=1 Tax=Araneus ventricosus TaxID=182803 RepID=A0A4Y2BTI7_ARAVE|nr:hypothetical protein AVEN_187525-1 [Araneus ventricosus]